MIRDAEATSLLDGWAGPHGGLPPFDRATPELIERAMHIAIARKRADIAAITQNLQPATFENTLEALEDAGRSLRRAETLRAAFFTTRAGESMRQVNARLVSLQAALDDEIAHDAILFERVAAVFAARGTLSPDQTRLTEVVYKKMLRSGAGLAAPVRARLVQLNVQIAEAQSQFHANILADAASRAVSVEDATELDGLSETLRAAAAKLASERGCLGQWAIGNTRSMVWSTLQTAKSRRLRAAVRSMWMTRCAIDGPNDNRPVISRIVQLRGEKARLLGYPSYAHWATADRMAATPERALALLSEVWQPVLRETNAREKHLQSLAQADGIAVLEAHDWLYYAEQYRQQHFGLNADEIKPYLEYRNILRAVLHAAARLHQLAFRELTDAPKVHDDVLVYEVTRCGSPIGVVWLDLLAREDKMRGSWQLELRAAESFRGPVISYSNVCSNLERLGSDGPVLMGWEYANVLFHEFGHALHMLLSRARYPSLGSMAVAWDLVEVPALLNERWLYDRDLLRQFARHYRTGEPMPEVMIDAIEAVARHERVFSVGLEYLLPAIVDMKLYLAADGSKVDPLRIERATAEELGMPVALDPVFRLPHQYHSFTDVYAAGVYVYLWADVMVADILEAFNDSPGGLYDAKVAHRWRENILSVGHMVPGELAFQHFRGRNPDAGALMRRFSLS